MKHHLIRQTANEGAMRATSVCGAVAATLLSLCALAGPALAQGANGPPNALQGFSQNKDLPVKIGAASLEVRDKEKQAMFSGNVHLVQGDTTMRCRSLVVFYDADTKVTAAKATQPGTPGQQQIRRIEMRGDVVVTQKDQIATGDNGAFEMATNTVTLNGNVVISQGPQVLKGQRLTVNLTSGLSRVDGSGRSADGGPGRVEMILQPNALNKPAAGTAEKPAGSSAGATPRTKSN